MYTVSCRYKRDYLHASIDILFYSIFYIINTMKKNLPFLYHACTHGTKKVLMWTWPPPVNYLQLHPCVLHNFVLNIKFDDALHSRIFVAFNSSLNLIRFEKGLLKKVFRMVSPTNTKQSNAWLMRFKRITFASLIFSSLQVYKFVW